MAAEQQTIPNGRGFAAMDRERQREIARMGGRAAHQLGTAHEFTSEEARAAGRKGGTASPRGEAIRRNPGRMDVQGGDQGGRE